MEQERLALDQVNLVVTIMEATVDFYRRLGLEIEDASPEWPNTHRSASGDGGIHLDFDSVEFAKTWNSGWQGNAAAGAGVVVGFRAASREAVDRLYAELTGAGYRGQQAPYDAFWGARYAVVEDPDGNAVGLMSPRDAAYRRAPDGETAPAAVPDLLPPIGAEVLDNRGEKFAHVRELSGEFFKLSVPLGADFWLLTAYVASVDGQHVHLSINRDDVDQYKLSGPNRDAVINDI